MNPLVMIDEIGVCDEMLPGNEFSIVKVSATSATIAEKISVPFGK